MSRVLVVAWALGWVGATLLLSGLRWFRTPSLVDRLRPYAPGGLAGRPSGGVMSTTSLRDVVAPMLGHLGTRLAQALGVSGDLAVRLRRAGLPGDVNAFRMRQGVVALAALTGSAAASALLSAPLFLAAAAMVTSPVLAFLVTEQRVVAASEGWQQQLTRELPVVIEQLGMLLSSGYSLGSALSRLANRGRGLCAAEFAGVCSRVRQGLSEIDALRELATYADVPELERLIAVLALNWEAADLGTLISAESRAVRRGVHRRQLEIIEKRGQQVWIPVTVATLLPGVIFMAVPFIDAMGKLTGS